MSLLSADAAAPKSWPAIAEREFWRDQCRRSLYDFARIAFGVARNPRGRWLSERVHRPLCDLLEREARGWLERRRRGEQGRLKLMVVVPRGFGKTVLVTKCFPMWLQLHDSELACVVDSESATKAEEFLASIKTVYEAGDPYALFSWLYGGWCDPDRLWRDSKFTHALRRQMSLTEPSFDSASVETGATGAHPDLLVLDDPISQERLREKGNWIELALRHVDALVPALRTDSMFVVVGTPYTNSDVIMTLIDREGIKETHGMPLPEVWPKPGPDGQWIVYFLQARGTDGKSILGEAWSDAELDDYEQKRPMDFAAQMMCTPGTGEHMPLTQEQVAELWVGKDDLPAVMHYTIHLDTAMKEKARMARGDESVICVWGHDVNRTGDVYFIEGHGSASWRVEDFTDKLVEIIKRYKKTMKRIRAVTDEVAIGGKQGVWEAHLRSCVANAGMYLPPFIEISRAGTKKIARITEAAGYWVDGHVHLLRGAPGVEKLVRQMLQIGVAAHDDWADASADVFHPAIYRPMLPLDEAKEAKDPRGPFDDYLKTGRLSDDGAREAYDREVEAEEERAWEHT